MLFYADGTMHSVLIIGVLMSRVLNREVPLYSRRHKNGDVSIPIPFRLNGNEHCSV